MEIMKMWNRDSDRNVDVYHIDYEKKIAYCFDPCLCQQQNGNGWQSIKLGKLVPHPYANDYKTGMSKTTRNKIKSFLTLTNAIWTCADGMDFDHAHIEDAIQHQAELLAKKIRMSNGL